MSVQFLDTVNMVNTSAMYKTTLYAEKACFRAKSSELSKLTIRNFQTHSQLPRNKRTLYTYIQLAPFRKATW